MAQDCNNVAGGSALAAVGIPDVHATALDSSLRYVDLNRHINHDYGILGQLFQAILDPGFRTTGASEAYPA